MANVMKNDTTREKLVVIMTKYIKECSKKLDEKTISIIPQISHTNWYYNGRSFSCSEINIGRDTYCFYDKEITDNDFINIVSTALKDSKCRGKIGSLEWDEYKGWSRVHHKRFSSLTLLCAPCKEFITLSKMIKKYTGKEISYTDINSSRACGKRRNWSVDADSTGYLCHEPNKCQDAIDFIRSKKTARDILLVEVRNLLEHDNEYDYKVAQEEEREWYATDYSYIGLKVKTPSGKGKGEMDVRAGVKYW